MKRYLLLCFFILSLPLLYAQDGNITDAFEDLKREGTVNEEFSIMRKGATETQLQQLLNEYSDYGFLCFTEDRYHDIRTRNILPERWIEMRSELLNQFKGKAQPGEFLTFQLGIFAHVNEIENISIDFTDLKSTTGPSIHKSQLNCFNLGGTDPYGKKFSKKVSVAKGEVQPLWIGVNIPEGAKGTYKGILTVKPTNAVPQRVEVEIAITGELIANKGDDEGWRKTRLHWLDSSIGNQDTSTTPYIPLQLKNNTITYLGGQFEISKTGLPRQIITQYTESNLLDPSVENRMLQDEIQFTVYTGQGKVTLNPSRIHITRRTPAAINWSVSNKGKDIELIVKGSFCFDGLVTYHLEVKAGKDIQIKDIRMEVPYTAYSAKYMMGLGHRGGLRKDTIIDWKWNPDKHQDKIWLGNVNSGLNFCFKDQNYSRPLVNIYYSLGKLNLPESWGNQLKGGITIGKETDNRVSLQAYSGSREMKKGDILHFNFNMLITPVKPINMAIHATERFYHSNSDVSANYIPEAVRNGANHINIHHKKDIYPFINYPFYDESIPDLKKFADEAHSKNIGVRLYYTTREVTVKLPELWAFRSLGSEIIHDGPGKDTRTLIHRNGPNEWLVKNLETNFIPAWYNAFKEGKYKGDMDISVITKPDSRWNNYYLEGLDWMIKKIGLDGVYIDDSALDHQTLQRARRILDADGKRRTIDIHSWNHMNAHAGYANSLHLYLELLPYVDRTWIGEGFSAQNSFDFWLVEMSGIPFGLLSETLDARNQFRGMVFGMLPRLPWSGNPVPLWKLWDEFGMASATLKGFWDTTNPVESGNKNLLATIYQQENKAMIIIANWSETPQKGTLKIDEKLLGFKPTKYSLPEIRNLQWEGSMPRNKNFEILGRSGMIIMVE